MEHCLHDYFASDDDMKICNLCGYVNRILIYDKEWKNYDIKSKNNSRCIIVHSKLKRGFRKILSNYDCINISESDICKAEMWFDTIINNTKLDEMIIDYKKRAIAAVCCFYILVDNTIPKSLEDICSLFLIKKRTFSKALTNFIYVYPDYKDIDIGSSIIIYDSLIKLNIYNIENYKNIIRLLDYVENSNRNLTKTTPKTLGIVCVWIYLYKTDSFNKIKHIKKYKDIKKYIKLIKIAEITFIKTKKNIENILNR